MSLPRVVVWNEYVHEQTHKEVAAIYPEGIHGAIIKGLKKFAPGIQAKAATLDMPEHGLSEAVLAETDVLIWWGHCAHHKVSEEVAERVRQRVLQGMGLIVLHSGHYSKPFIKLMGTSCSLTWREAGERERLWVTQPGHPIVEGIDTCIEIEHEEMYGEPFGIPTPNEQVFISWFEGGEVFRSGCTYLRGNGKIFYFRPGHETYPTYHLEPIQRVITNAVLWAKPQGNWAGVMKAPNVPVEKAREKIKEWGSSVH